VKIVVDGLRWAKAWLTSRGAGSGRGSSFIVGDVNLTSLSKPSTGATEPWQGGDGAQPDGGNAELHDIAGNLTPSRRNAIVSRLGSCEISTIHLDPWYRYKQGSRASLVEKKPSPTCACHARRALLSPCATPRKTGSRRKHRTSEPAAPRALRPLCLLKAAAGELLLSYSILLCCPAPCTLFPKPTLCPRAYQTHHTPTCLISVPAHLKTILNH
jgi:hypothetical protein